MTSRVLGSPLFASLTQTTGLLRVLETLPRERGLYALNYHRIGTIEGNPLDDAVFSATVESLRAQMTYLQRHFATPPPHEVLESVRRGRFNEPTVLVTFDDGYRDNYDLAFPVLRDLGIPGCFFVVSGYIDAPTLPWWDHVAYAVKRTTVEVLTLEYPERLQIELRSTARPAAIARILRAYKRARPLDQERFFAGLAAATRVDVDGHALARNLFAPWVALREMQQGGMTIGSHTATHPILSALPPEAQRRELVASRERIGEMLGDKPDLLAYPVGGPSAFSETTQHLAREAGYKAAFSFFGGFNHPDRLVPFAIGRAAVEVGESLPQFRLATTLATLPHRRRSTEPAHWAAAHDGSDGGPMVRGDVNVRRR